MPGTYASDVFQHLIDTDGASIIDADGVLLTDFRGDVSWRRTENVVGVDVAAFIQEGEQGDDVVWARKSDLVGVEPSPFIDSEGD